MKAAGKVLVVTGAGSGIGREVALEALRRGARVAAVDINETTLMETATLAAADGALSTHVVNVADRAAVEALPEEVIARYGVVDGLIHCAGVLQPLVKVKDLDYAAIEHVFAVNWWGTVYLTKTFLPLLLARPEGHIVNVSSMGGFMPFPGQTIYGASKAAVKLFTEGLHAECADTNVGVTVVLPGVVATNLATNSGVEIPIDAARAARPMRRIVTARKAAQGILDGVEKDAYRVLIGRDAKLVDILCRATPRRSASFIATKMKELLPETEVKSSAQSP